MGDAVREQVIRLVYEASEGLANANKANEQLLGQMTERAEKAEKKNKEVAEAEKKANKDREASTVSWLNVVKSAEALREKLAKDTAREISEADKKANKEREATTVSWLSVVKSAEDLREKISKKTARDIADADALEKKRREQSTVSLLSVVQSAEALKVRLAKEAVATQEAQTAAIGGTIESMIRFTSASLGLTAVGSVLMKVVEAWEAVRISSQKATEEILHQAGLLRPLAATGGTLGQPSKEIAGQLELRNQTYQTEEGAREMMTKLQASGLGAVSEPGLVAGKTEEERWAELKRAAVASGKLQMMAGTNATDVGDVAGLMPFLTGKQQNTAQDLINMQARLYKISKVGDFHNYGEFAKQMGIAAPRVMSGEYTGPQAAAMLGMFALGGQGETAGEHLQMLSTAMTGGLLRNRGMRNIAPEFQEGSEKSADYFKRIGITAQDDRFAAEKKLVANLLAEEDLAHREHRRWDADLFLQERGMIMQQGRAAAIKIASVARASRGKYEGMLELGTVPVSAADDTMTEDWQKALKDPFNRKQVAQTRTDILRARQGTEEGGQFRDIMMQSAYNAYGGPKAFGGHDLKTVEDTSKWNPEDWLFNRGSTALKFRAGQLTIEEAKRVGNVGGAKELEGTLAGNRTWEQMFRVAQKNQEMGGELTPGASPETTMAANTEEIKGLREDMRGYFGGRGAGPPAGVGAPAARAAVPPPHPAKPAPASGMRLPSGN